MIHDRADLLEQFLQVGKIKYLCIQLAQLVIRTRAESVELQKDNLFELQKGNIGGVSSIRDGFLDVIVEELPGRPVGRFEMCQ